METLYQPKLNEILLTDYKLGKEKYIALLRGINVGGHHKVPKAMEILEKYYGKDNTTRNWNTIERIGMKIKASS